MATVKFLTGAKDNIDAQLQSGVADECDVIFTSDTDEIAFINPSKEKKFIKSRTSKAYTLNGTSLGALADGSTIEAGISIDDLLQLITEKAIPAEYTDPTVSFSRTTGTSAGSYEVGTVIDVSVKSTFTQNDAGAITNHQILKGSEVLETQATAANTFTKDNITFTLGEETVTLKSQVSWADGAIKNNNLNQPSPEGQILAGSKASSGLSFVGKRNLFYGTGVGIVPTFDSSSVRALAETENGGVVLGPKAGTTFSIPVAVGQQYVAFAYPASVQDVTQIMYVETNDTGMKDSFTQTTVNVEGANGADAVSYRLYTFGMDVPAAAGMTFKVTI